LVQFKISVSYFNVFNVLYSCNGKAEFSASLLQSSVLHDPAQSMIIWC